MQLKIFLFSFSKHENTLIPYKRIYNIKYLEKQSYELKEAYTKTDIQDNLNFKKFHSLTVFLFL